MKVLVTGASGFIGSHFVHRLLEDEQYTVKALVRNSDQKNLKRLCGSSPEEKARIADFQDSGRLHIIYGDLLGDISGICENIDWVVHFAARTFVDHAILDPLPFIESNVMGTYKILEDARRYKIKRFILVSTDEIMGSILQGAYAEDARMNPTNPYAASKVGAEALAICYAHTYGLHTTVTRTENNYGKFQHPQKVFPVFTKKAINDQKLPIYGAGDHVRQWIYVDDHVSGILTLLNADYPKGEVFHIAGNQELTNLELAKKILKVLGKPESLISFIDDSVIRPGHDKRYALNSDKLRKMGWEPKIGLDEGIKKTVEWYAQNKWWSE